MTRLFRSPANRHAAAYAIACANACANAFVSASVALLVTVPVPAAWAAPGVLAVPAATAKTPQVTAELVAESTALVPGTTTLLALRFEIAPGWHTYWKNPGESGLPTTIDWKLPPGYRAGAIEWPAPRALAAGPLINYGYEGEVLHLVQLTVPADAAVGTTAALHARADWLVCKETCIPEGADLALTLPVATSADSDPKWGPAIAAAQAALPQPLPGWQASAAASPSTPTIALALTPPPGAGDPGAIRFFANAAKEVEPSAPQTLAREPDGRYVLTLPIAHDAGAAFTRVAGVLTAERGFDAGGQVSDRSRAEASDRSRGDASRRPGVRAITLDVALTGTPIPGPNPARSANVTFGAGAAAGTATGSIAAVGPLTSGSASVGAGTLALPVALLLAIAGGLLLNLMPCVFPVLSIKALQLATGQGESSRTLRTQALAFAAGVVATFVALAIAIVILRRGGDELGWGFQLQSPAVVAGLAILFFVLALNLSGVFEFGSIVPDAVASWSHRNRHVDAFGSGVLAVVVASPCTAPFMAAALGYALTASLPLTLGVFVALGLGMALPWLALAWFPGWRRFLPRPGAWMLRVKQLLAFPLYATVAWLVWVLGAQVGNDGVLRMGVALVLAAFALWAWRAFRGGGARAWSVAAIVGVLAGAVVAWPLFAAHPGPEVTAAVDARAAPAALAPSPWKAYSARRLAQLVDGGHTVFVDFTAAWCVTCQVNERFVLHTAAVSDAFEKSGVVRMRADWTRRDPEITRALAALGRSGVPAYVVYRPGRAPQVLPELLRERVVIEALGGI